MMNILNSCFASRFSRVALTCCKEKPPGAVSALPSGHKLIPCRTQIHKALPVKCSGKLQLSSGLTMWTQVRFQKECPRLHRDINFPNFDAYRKDDYLDVRRTNWGSGDGKPGYTYIVSVFGLIGATYGAKSVVTHFISYMSAAADVLALASIEVDLSKVAAGGTVSFKWRGKPLFVKNRTQSDIDSEANTPMSALRDPQTPEQRAPNSEWLIVIGICTHLGCVPIPNSGDWPGGFYCPCHGSHYDNIGRIRKGPAPLNLEIPPYKFISETLVLVG
ncbi:cytochrome b-c1 complex subunit Rieske, mitochondrial-like [Plodia interpunctella]|uniref:cytochrome b-c1 complex subunit Rieske, mitochondrial-like n=1 Tax=Plodia interpunctella TaxID=58824 RepID=UPI002367DD75|nr:cytochrome b-c1 complex subunit Rieske, mitochondrial-like [Plodia interpunctella]